MWGLRGSSLLAVGGVALTNPLTCETHALAITPPASPNQTKGTGVTAKGAQLESGTRVNEVRG